MIHPDQFSGALKGRFNPSLRGRSQSAQISAVLRSPEGAIQPQPRASHASPWEHATQTIPPRSPEGAIQGRRGRRRSASWVESPLSGLGVFGGCPNPGRCPGLRLKRALGAGNREIPLGFPARWLRLSWIHCAAVIGLTLFDGSAAQPSKPVAPGARPLVWPPPPDAPRVAYVQSIVGPADIGVKRSFFQT